MPDITMCQGFDCKRRNECYRYRAVPSIYQSWFAEKPRNENCFMKIDMFKRIREVKEIEKEKVITLDVQNSIMK